MSSTQLDKNKYITQSVDEVNFDLHDSSLTDRARNMAKDQAMAFDKLCLSLTKDNVKIDESNLQSEIERLKEDGYAIEVEDRPVKYNENGFVRDSILTLFHNGKVLGKRLSRSVFEWDI